MNFQATLPATIRKRKTVSKKAFLLLSEENREWYNTSYPRRKVYKEILPPIINPKIEKMRKKLKKYRIKWREHSGFKSGKECIFFEQFNLT